MTNQRLRVQTLTILCIATAIAGFGCNQAGPAGTAGTTTPASAATPASASTPAPANAPADAPAASPSDAPAPAPVPAASAAAPATAAAAAAPAPAPPEWREVTLPAGTALHIVLETTVGSDISRVEEPVQARLTRAVMVHGQAVVPDGSRVSGVVTDATRSGKVKGRAHIAIRFTTLVPEGGDTADARYRIETASVGRTAPATKKKDAFEIGGAGAGGALIGALVGGKKGALVGTAIGGGAGTAAVLSTRGQEVRLATGAALDLRLSRPVTVRVRER